ncbi:hypothetical protein MJI69_31050, partial [Salmonella enterica subsp. enterica serovar Anatum]|nr:hypothetical protein [Salmonella enterica subsp. enterica serovar Anatum]
SHEVKVTLAGHDHMVGARALQMQPGDVLNSTGTTEGILLLNTPKEESVKLFHDYLDLHRSNPALDVQMVPVSVMFGRAPGREKG